MGYSELCDAPLAEGMGEVAVMDPSGDTKVIFDPNNADEVENARKTFEDLKAKGFSAFKVVGAKGEKSDEQLFEFDPTAGRMILIPALQGG